MAHGKLMSLTAGMVATVALAVCVNTLSQSHGSEPQVRGAVAGHRVPPESKDTTFATTNREAPTDVPHTAIQRLSAEIPKVPDRLTKMLSASPEPERANTEPRKATHGDERVLTAVARELGLGRPGEPSATEKSRAMPQRGVSKGGRQIGKIFEALMSNGKRRPQTSAPPVSTVAPPKPVPATTGLPTGNPLLEKIHRDATSMQASAPTKNADSTRDDTLRVPAVMPSVGNSDPAAVKLSTPPPALFASPNGVVPNVPPVASGSQLHHPTNSPHSSTVIGPASARFAHSEDYRSLTGEVQLWRNTWRLRYARVDETDKYGGSVVLAGENRFSDLRDGQIIRVQGRIVQSDARTGTVFEVQAIDVLEK